MPVAVTSVARAMELKDPLPAGETSSLKVQKQSDELQKHCRQGRGKKFHVEKTDRDFPRVCSD